MASMMLRMSGPRIETSVIITISEGKARNTSAKRMTRTIHRATKVARDRAQHDADGRIDRHGDQPDRQADAPRVHEAGVYVAPCRIRAKPVRGGRRFFERTQFGTEG